VTGAVTEGSLTPAQARLVTELASAARETDGVAPLSERTLLHVRQGASPDSGGRGSTGRDWLVTVADGGVAGYAHLDPPDDSAAPESEGGFSGELVVHPAHRRRGHGTALVSALTAAAQEHGSGGHGIGIWAHGDLPAAAELARAAGFTRARELWQMLLPAGAPVPEPVMPEVVTLRTFVPGADEEAWLAVNRRAFAHHPEQGSWTREDLELREAEPWFDPAGFFLAVRSPAEPGGDRQLAGFHWTKVHPSGGTSGGPIGEVYVVGVDPAAHGGGLGKALTIAGLAYLRARGLAEIMLYVDGDNTPATKLYTGLGFTRWHTDVMYERRPDSRR
jgi:mycothiol synthase